MEDKDNSQKKWKHQLACGREGTFERLEGFEIGNSILTESCFGNRYQEYSLHRETIRVFWWRPIDQRGNWR